jgi:hypothetical protein
MHCLVCVGMHTAHTSTHGAQQQRSSLACREHASSLHVVDCCGLDYVLQSRPRGALLPRLLGPHMGRAHTCGAGLTGVP